MAWIPLEGSPAWAELGQFAHQDNTVTNKCHRGLNKVKATVSLYAYKTSLYAQTHACVNLEKGNILLL